MNETLDIHRLLQKYYYEMRSYIIHNYYINYFLTNTIIKLIIL